MNAANGSLPPAPYANARMLPQVVGKQVRVVGRVAQVSPSGDRVHLEVSDPAAAAAAGSSGVVVVARQRGAAPYASRYVCVTGIVQSDFSVSEARADAWGDDFNVGLFDKFVNASVKAPTAFATLN